MNFFQKTKGAISIFLVIILVPMITLSGLFVDAGRVKLSRAVMSSAGDLVMNTALTNYDTVLKDMYGLFATAQDKEDLFAKLEDYYRTSIISAGVNGEEADAYVAYLMKTLGMVSEEETSDLLNMQLIDFAINEVENANMANATIVKSGIVNFMKYRGPINIGLSFFNALQTFTSLSKSTELVEKRKEYYEEQESVMKNCKEAWKYINNYNKNDMLKTETYFDDFKNESRRFKEKYTDIGKKIIKDLYDTQRYANNPLKPLRDYDFDYESNAQMIERKIRAFNDAVTRLEEKEREVNEYVYPDGAYDLQYLVQGNRRKIFENYANAMENLNKCYQDLICAIENEMEEIIEIDEVTGLPIVRKEKVSPTRSTTEYDNIFESKKRIYDEKLSKLSRIAESIGTKVDPTETNNKIVELYNKFTKFKNDLEDAKRNLDKALEYLNKVYNAVKPEGTLEKIKSEWEATTRAEELANSPLAKQDAAEIKNLSSFLKANEVEALINRLRNISTNLGNMLSELEKFAFFDTKLSEIKDYESMKNVIEGEIGSTELKSVPIKEIELNNKINIWLLDCFTEGEVNADWINRTGTQINLSTQDKLNFYVFLYTNFNKVEENSSKESEGRNLHKEARDKLEDKAEDIAEEAEAEDEEAKASREIKDKPELPSKLNVGGGQETQSGKVTTNKDSAVSDTKKSLSGMFSNLGRALKNAGITLRDDIYISDYIMSMFSYDTIEKELKHDHPDADLKSMLKTLTKNPIDEDHNFAYRREIEYIIFGGKNSSNVKKAYGSIFGIRLAFNLIYAFTDSEIRDGAMAIAVPISAATFGVVPAPLIQVGIIIGISIAESALDIKDLKKGEPVPLFKNKQTWRVSLTGVVSVLKKEAMDVLQDAANNVIDEARNRLSEFLDKTDQELQEMINSGAREVEELLDSVEASFNSMIDRHASMAIQKVTTLISNAIEEAKMDDKFNKVKYIEEGLDKWLEEERAISGADSLSYIAKYEAVNIIKGQINTLLTQFESAINSVTESAESAIINIGEILKGELDIIRSEINQKLADGTERINAYRENMKEQIRSSIDDGAEALKNTINEKLDGVFGGTTGEGISLNKGDSTGMASLLSFQYSDYLRLFTLIGLLANPDAILLRTADVIQCNMQLIQSDESYRLKNAVAYVEVNATVQVKPLFLALPLFADVESNPKDDSNWYTIKYKGIKGY
ncbi:DUF5702 domain-containing protein [Acetivibrio clariflavus]|uniref:DUF5702 domain-containing protein n=1 Tax=Acetivibrio clariflavus TaxID=288965 RepID=UPI0031F4C3FD